MVRFIDNQHIPPGGHYLLPALVVFQQQVGAAKYQLLSLERVVARC